MQPEVGDTAVNMRLVVYVGEGTFGDGDKN
jgi:hypothetical protein